MRQKVYFGPGIRLDWEQTTTAFDFMTAQAPHELSLTNRSCVNCNTESMVCQDTLLQGCHFNAMFYLFIRSGTEELGLIVRSLGPWPPSCLYHAYFSGILLWFEPQGVLLNKWVTQDSVSQSCWYGTHWKMFIFYPWLMVLNNIPSHHLCSGNIRTNLACTLFLSLLPTSIECFCIPFLRF